MLSEYLSQYSEQMLYSAVYFVAIGFAGLFLQLRRASLFGLMLSQAAKASLILGFGLHYLFSGKQTSVIAVQQDFHDEGHLLELDFYVFILFYAIVFIVQSLVERLKKYSSRETWFVLVFLVLAALIPLLLQWLNLGEQAVSGYFTEILYTTSNVFSHYIPLLLVFLFLLFWFGWSFLFIGMDEIQARLSGYNVSWLNLAFYIICGGLVLLAVRVLGPMTAIVGMLAPGFLMLAIAKNLKILLFGTFIMSLILPLIGFFVSFTFPDWPVSPVMQFSMIISSLIFWALWRAFTWSSQKLRLK